MHLSTMNGITTVIGTAGIVAAMFCSHASAQTEPAWQTSGNAEEGDPLIRVANIPATDIAFYLDRAGGQTEDPENDTPTLTMLKTGEDPEGDTPSAVAFTTDGEYIVIAHRESQNLIVWDADTRAFVGEIPLSGSPNAMAMSPNGTYAITANIFENTASIVNLNTLSEIAVIDVGDTPGVAEISPNGAVAAIGNFVDGSVSIINMSNGNVEQTIPGIDFVASLSANVETFAVTVSVEPFRFAGNTKLVHADYYGDVINVINLVSGNVTSLPCDEQPRGVAVAPDGSVAAIAHGYKPFLTVVDPVNETIVKTIPMGQNTTGPVCLNPAGSKAAVAVSNACVVVDLVSETVSPNISTASVYGLLTTADGQYALGVGYYGSLVSFASESLVKNLNNKVSTPLGATSPVGTRAALCSNSFGEDLVVVDTDGANGFLEAYLLSGPEPEGDKCRTIAVSDDGNMVTAVNIYSDTLTVFDVASQTIVGYGQTGERPAEVALTPDGAKAVVCNLDSYFATVIDLNTFTESTVSIGRRASQVEISPDGQYAYIAVVADGDGVYRLNLDTMSVEGSKIITGNMGSVGYAYWQTSGISLSHDGTVLAVCGSFDDEVTFIDTVNWVKIADVSVGDFPTYCTFSADDSRLYVTNRDGDSVSVLEDSGSWSLVDTINVGDFPYILEVTDDDSTLYVLNYSDKSVGVIDVVSGVQTDTVALPNSPGGMVLSPDENTIYVACGNASASLGGSGFTLDWYGELVAIDTTTLLTETFDTGVSPAQLVFNAAGTIGAIASPVPDVAIIIEPELTTCLSLTVENLVAGETATWTVTGVTPGTRAAIVYGFRNGRKQIAGVGGYCATFDFQDVNERRIIGQPIADGTGTATKTQDVPAGASGIGVFMQAAEKGTCPDECVSNLIEATIQ